MLIQVFSFQTFRKRVFLMAPIHHHFELHGVVGDEDHPALLDRRRDLRAIGFTIYQQSVVRVVTASIARPRAAAAAAARPARRRRLTAAARASPPGARCCAARWREPGVAVDARRAGAAGRRRASRCTCGTDGARRCSSACARVVEVAGRAARGAGDRGGARARASRCSASSSSRWRLLPERVRRRDRARTARRRRSSCSATSTARPGCRSPSPATSATRAELARRRARRPTRPSSARRRSFQLEDTLAFAPEAAVLLNLAPDHLDRHGTLEAYRAAKLQRLRAPGQRRRRGRARRARRRGPRRLRAARARSGAGGELADRAGQLWWDDEPLIAHDEIRLRGAHNRENAVAAAAIALARGVDPDAVRAGAAHVRRRRAPARGGRDASTACSTSTTRRRRTSTRTLVALASFEPRRCT